MEKNQITYICPKAATCPAHKHCHVLTTESELPVEIAVWQQCVAAGKNPDGTKKEILIYVGPAA